MKKDTASFFKTFLGLSANQGHNDIQQYLNWVYLFYMIFWLPVFSPTHCNLLTQYTL